MPITRQYIHDPNAQYLTAGERIADRVSKAIGSWHFIIIQTICVVLWVVMNFVGLILRWDPYPFILLNLMFSVQAAYTGPILLLASNRQAQKDRAIAIKDDEELDDLKVIQDEQLVLLKELHSFNDHILKELGSINENLGSPALVSLLTREEARLRASRELQGG